MFAGGVPTYGQTVSEDVTTQLAYLRALRRIDPCGLVLALKDVGAPTYISGDVGGCFGSIKVAGIANPSSVGLSLLWGDPSLDKPEFTVGQTPVYHSPGTCLFEFPIALDKLPNAPKLKGPRKPMLRVVVVDGSRSAMSTNCKVARPVINVLVAMNPAELPVRDALGAYPIKIAERDPCEILAEYPGRARGLRPSLFGDPFSCRFSLQGSDTQYELTFRAGVDPPSKLRRDVRDGIEYFHGENSSGSVTGCTSMVRLGKPLYARDVPGGAPQENGTPERVFIEVLAFSMKDGDCGPTRAMIDKAVQVFRSSFD
ncbi:hypothetical protein FZI91_21825 [Mycobacterium sp. CBMA271]|uniref:hypothetical protein n=1 Tax=unclassified Mycobacteroides TaxID=2618759 RepID=UPI0012DD1547|nr:MULTISPECIES: hypothetical protein [unclassified Mycobacteroides]MUM19719.1 hypothetical protein [Mycobacteroides sp. CBMA 326]MUM24323.1 hypothetical protein [Mycobacteroides sp. CBMA 271]